MSEPRQATPRQVARRRFLVVSGALVVAACGRTASEPGSGDPANSVRRSERPGRPATPTSLSPTPSPTATAPAPHLPEVQPWRPSEGEVEPEVKLAAAGVIEALGTATTWRTPAQRLEDIGAAPELAEQAAPLVPDAPAVVEIVYPQYGGLRDTSASVMTVAEQTWLTDDQLRRRTLTIDVRLSRTTDRWAVTKLLPAEVIDVAELTLSGDVAALVDSPRLALPDAAVADLAGGVVDPRVIATLLQLSEEYEMSVSVFRSGHPRNVFGTDRVSNHTRGRAVDIWAINEVPVVAMTTTDPVLLGFITAARELGSDEIGAPVDPDGPGGAHFADRVHRDHVHLGFRG